ncbi:cell division protein FtsQ/DivIB [Motiliproteus sp.]|uniref:cell division protein FtsQ/DivIB n=1 Tax=Motiliproteus sp. TaxID=1898955 RepID=UPI003BABC9F8
MSAAAVEPTSVSARGWLDPYRIWLWLQLPLWLLGLVWAGQQFQGWIERPLEQIQVGSDRSTGQFKQLSSEQLQQQLWQLPTGSYAQLDLQAFKQSLEQLAWVHSVQLKRSWPDQLEVVVREQRPIARWGSEGLVNEEGHIFSPAEDFARQQQDRFKQLPQLMGPEHRSLGLMAQFHHFSRMLQPLGLELDGLEMEPRGAWTLTLKNGIRLVVGRGQVIEKLQRFKQVYGDLLGRYAERIKQVDVRYTNGLAVTWTEPPTPAAPAKAK